MWAIQYFSLASMVIAVTQLLFHPEMGDNGSGPFIILIFILYFLVGAAAVCGLIYLVWKLLTRLRGVKKNRGIS